MCDMKAVGQPHGFVRNQKNNKIHCENVPCTALCNQEMKEMKILARGSVRMHSWFCETIRQCTGDPQERPTKDWKERETYSQTTLLMTRHFNYSLNSLPLGASYSIIEKPFVCLNSIAQLDVVRDLLHACE